MSFVAATHFGFSIGYYCPEGISDYKVYPCPPGTFGAQSLLQSVDGCSRAKSASFVPLTHIMFKPTTFLRLQRRSILRERPPERTDRRLQRRLLLHGRRVRRRGRVLHRRRHLQGGLRPGNGLEHDGPRRVPHFLSRRVRPGRRSLHARIHVLRGIGSADSLPARNLLSVSFFI